MILSIELFNCGPFKNWTKLSMVPYDYGGKLQNLSYDSIERRLLNTSVIYGKNSAGKTSFVKALWALVQEVRVPTGANTRLCMSSSFALDVDTKDMPSELKLRFSLDGSIYLYHVKYNSTEFLYECLEVTLADRTVDVLFCRKGENKAQHNVIFSDRGTQGAQKINLVNRNNLVVSQYKQYPGDEIGMVGTYIANMQISNGYNPRMQSILWDEIRPWLSDEKADNRNKIITFLKALDISVDGINIPRKSDSTFDDIAFKHQIYKQGKPIENKYTLFDIQQESQGTKWLLLLGAKIIDALEHGYPLLIDEIDACFHSQATIFIMQLFKDPEINKHSAQLVLTTHNINLMDEKELRRDQVWFVQKDEKGVSELYSLSEFDGVDENVNFAEWYLANRFGGMPTLGSIKELFS